MQAVREWAVNVVHKLLVNVLVYVGGGGDTRSTVVSLFCSFCFIQTFGEAETMSEDSSPSSSDDGT